MTEDHDGRVPVDPGAIVFQTASDAGSRHATIADCLQSVRRWANRSGHEYRFVNDEFFEVLPPRFADMRTTNTLAATDLARLLWAQLETAKGRTFVWMDADVFVADPAARLMCEIGTEAFAREMCLDRLGGEVVAIKAVNNSVSVFRPGGAFLAYHITWCFREADRWGDRLSRCHFGTDFLTATAETTGVPLIDGTGSFTTYLTDEIAAGGMGLVATHALLTRAPLAFVNLCGSLGALPDERSGPFVNRLRTAIGEHNRLTSAGDEAYAKASPVRWAGLDYSFGSTWFRENDEREVPQPSEDDGFTRSTVG